MHLSKIIVTTLTLLSVSFSQAQDKKLNNREVIATYETSQKTIDKINQLMGVETVTPSDNQPKKRLVIEGDLSDRKVVKKAPETSSETDNTVMSYLTQQLINVAKTYQGVRYVWGGMSRNGMDCSGFVKTAFDFFNINLPRTSRAMASRGEKIKTSEAKPGDLIFFRNGGSRVINHVGIIIEVKDDDELVFIHSASSKGVSINSTKESYWSKNFYQVNRVYERPTL